MSDSIINMCPSCGAFINKDSPVCPNCNKALDNGTGDDFEKDLEELIHEDPDLENSHICPGCGGKLDHDSLECPSCDMRIEDELDMIGQESEAVSLFLCSGCGAFISSDSIECPNCGIPLNDDNKDEEPVIEYDDELLELLVEKDDLDVEEALNEMDGISDSDGLMSLVDRMADSQIDESDVLDSDEVENKDEDEPIIISIEEVELDVEADRLHDNLNKEIDKVRIVEGLGEKLSEEVVLDGGEGDSIKLCLECGAFVSPSLKECNVCGSEAGDGKYLRAETDNSDEIAKQRDGNTESALREILGILDEVSVESEVMEVVDEVIGICGECGAFIPPGEDNCPVCGTPGSDMQDMPGLEDMHSEETGSLSICGECGAFLKPGLGECNVCGTEVIFHTPETSHQGEGEDIGRVVDDSTDILKKALGLMEMKDISQNGTMSGEIELCPDCGAFVSKDTRECGVCGSSFETGVGDELGIVIDLEGEDIKLSKNICPNCGSRFGVGAGECGVCGFNFLDDDLGLGELEVLESSDPGEGVDISDIIELEIPGLDIEVEEKDGEVDGIELDDLTLEIDGEPEEEEKTPPPEPSRTGTRLTDSEKLERLEKAYLDGKLSKANYLINKARFYGIANDIKNIEDRVEEEFQDFLADMDKTLTSTEIEPPSQISENEIHPIEEDGQLDSPESTRTGAYLPEQVESEEQELPASIGEETEQDDEPVVEEIVEYIDVGPDEESEEDGEYEIEYIEVEEVESVEEITEFEELDSPGTKEVQQDDDNDEPVIEEIEEYPGVGRDGDFQARIQEAAEARRQVEFKTFPVDGAKSRQEQYSPSGWEYGVYWSLFTSVFFVSLGSYFDLHPISLAAATGIGLVIALFMMITSRSTFVRSDLAKGSLFMIGSFIISFILLHWFANVMIDNPQLDNILLSIGIVLIGMGIIWVRGSLRYIHLWIAGTIFLFLFAIGDMFYFDQWAFSPIQPPGMIIAGLGISMIIISTIMLAHERNIHTSIETEIVRGDMDYMNKDYKQALRSYDVALERSRAKSADENTDDISGGYDVPWYSKGAALILMGQIEEGIECLDMALSINPNNEVAWVSKGNAYSRLGDPDNAIESYNNALISNPRYVIAWNNRGNAFARKKDYIEALNNYNRAIKLNPNYQDAWINKGYVLMKMGKQDEALRCVSMIDLRERNGGGQSKAVASA